MLAIQSKPAIVEMRIRRAMNEADTAARTKAVTLLNFETVKYFGNETAEVTGLIDPCSNMRRRQFGHIHLLAG